MFHFTKLKTQITDSKALVAALADLRFRQVEVHDSPQHLYGYEGDVRQQTADVIVRRRFVGRRSNDIGFQRQSNGTFIAIISEFDRAKYSRKWLDRLTQRYAYHAARSKLEEQGFALVSEETLANGQIHLVLRRMA